MKKLSNTEAELKKMLLTKKGCIPMLNRINNKLSRVNKSQEPMFNCPFKCTSQIMPFSRECFFQPLWKTIKNSGRAGSGREDRQILITTKFKGN